MSDQEFEITLSSGRRFRAKADESLLDAALRQNIGLIYGCKNGACGACKATLKSGEVDDSAVREGILSQEDRQNGAILTCCTRAKSDLELEAKESDGVQIKTLPARIESLERVHNVALLKIRLPASENFVFKAGQYIDILMKDGKARSFSLANPPHRADCLELHIRYQDGGVFSEYAFNHLKVRDILRFKGPLGSFFVREDSDKPMILLASGTGFAPIQSIVEHLLHVGAKRPMTLYWGARNLKELYAHETALAWARDLADFRYIPVLSDQPEDEAWDGRRGLVHEAVLADFADLSGFEVYACGAPVMVEAAYRDFTTQRALPEDAFFSDAFYAIADKK